MISNELILEVATELGFELFRDNTGTALIVRRDKSTVDTFLSENGSVNEMARAFFNGVAQNRNETINHLYDTASALETAAADLLKVRRVLIDNTRL